MLPNYLIESLNKSLKKINKTELISFIISTNDAEKVYNFDLELSRYLDSKRKSTIQYKIKKRLLDWFGNKIQKWFNNCNDFNYIVIDISDDSLNNEKINNLLDIVEKQSF